jgi:hypothetical protein
MVFGKGILALTHKATMSQELDELRPTIPPLKGKETERLANEATFPSPETGSQIMDFSKDILRSPVPGLGAQTKFSREIRPEVSNPP